PVGRTVSGTVARAVRAVAEPPRVIGLVIVRGAVVARIAVIGPVVAIAPIPAEGEERVVAIAAAIPAIPAATPIAAIPTSAMTAATSTLSECRRRGENRERRAKQRCADKLHRNLRRVWAGGPHRSAEKARPEIRQGETTGPSGDLRPQPNISAGLSLDVAAV